MPKAGRPLLFIGQARLPKGISESERVQVVVEVDSGTKKILDAGCIPCHPVVEKFLREILIGVCMDEGIDPVLEELSTRFYSRITKAITTALHDIYRKYQEKMPPKSSE